MRLFVILVIAVFLGACATSSPIEMTGVDKNITPDRAVADIDTAPHRRVAWGGTIVNTRNLKDVTEIEVLGYPLGTDGRPDLGANPQRRFLAVRDGFLEPADYRSGRLISATGTVTGIRNGMVGQAPYIYPVLQGDQIYLWPIGEERRNPNVNFGIGVGVIFGR